MVCRSCTAHGVELVVDLLDAADNIDKIPAEELRVLLRETAFVLGDLLKRDKPERLPSDAALAAGMADETSRGFRRP